MAVACTALAVALGGTGYAASQLPANSVDKRAIKRGAVGSSEIRAPVGVLLARPPHDNLDDERRVVHDHRRAVVPVVGAARRARPAGRARPAARRGRTPR